MISQSTKVSCKTAPQIAWAKQIGQSGAEYLKTCGQSGCRSDDTQTTLLTEGSARPAEIENVFISVDRRYPARF
jgi:hypothetical protein